MSYDGTPAFDDAIAYDAGAEEPTGDPTGGATSFSESFSFALGRTVLAVQESTEYVRSALVQRGRSREIYFPFHVNNAGEIAWETNRITIYTHHLVQIVGTEQRERVMRATYGARLRRFLFDVQNDVLDIEILTEVRAAVQVWEPSCTIVQIDRILHDDPVRGIAGYRVHFTTPDESTAAVQSVVVDV